MICIAARIKLHKRMPPLLNNLDLEGFGRIDYLVEKWKDQMQNFTPHHSSLEHAEHDA